MAIALFAPVVTARHCLHVFRQKVDASLSAKLLRLRYAAQLVKLEQNEEFGGAIGGYSSCQVITAIACKKKCEEKDECQNEQAFMSALSKPNPIK